MHLLPLPRHLTVPRIPLGQSQDVRSTYEVLAEGTRNLRSLRYSDPKPHVCRPRESASGVARGAAVGHTERNERGRRLGVVDSQASFLVNDMLTHPIWS
ncbi:hypothetical protein B0H11DRAFT_2254338 [Mycena galericulata]|nr:hypothetical protein B0H11DRAFT_2254338 [Mycena galericulata]